MSLDEYLITNKEATYILKVNGESVIEAGILPSDMLLVERGAEARDGDSVIAPVDRAWTMKYFRQRGRAVLLEAANKDLERRHKLLPGETARKRLGIPMFMGEVT
jgi:SOS-response transcriptional repressor LexA